MERYKIKRPDFSDVDEHLSPEVKEVASKAREAMDQWIDQSVDDLTQQIGDDIKQAAEAFGAEVEKVAQALEASRRKIDELAGQIDNIDFESGDGAEIREAVEASKRAIAEVQAELASREAQWKGLGQSVVTKTIASAKKLIGL
jgi:methyl-accepting chemotaxis protein